MSIKVAVSSTCSAFNLTAIGTAVTGVDLFFELLTDLIKRTDFSKAAVPGQVYIQLEGAILRLIQPGVVERNPARGKWKPDDYVLREHRGIMGAYIKRSVLSTTETEVDGGAVVIYTQQTYNNDPDVIREKSFVDDSITHVIVAVLGYKGPPSQLSYERFVENIAGGNKEALTWGSNEIRERARMVAAYNANWVVVAD